MASSLFFSLRRAETSGRAARSLIELPRSICERLDGARQARLREGEKDSRMSVRLIELQHLIQRQRRRSSSPSPNAMRELVAEIGVAALDAQRTSFLACRGDVLLLHLLHLVGQHAAEERFQPLINEIVQIVVRPPRCEPSRTARTAHLHRLRPPSSPLRASTPWARKRVGSLALEHACACAFLPFPDAIVVAAPVVAQAELAISDGDLAEAFATDQALLSLLFRLMAHKQLVDAALTLAQELLAIGPDVFPLAAVPQLPELLTSLTPRGLSLVGRALAVLLAKAAEDSADGLPAPECTPPHLCASCANNTLLLNVPNLLARVVALLRLRSPPPGLWGHMLTQLPNTPLPNTGPHGLGAHWDEGEGDAAWERLGEAPPAPANVVVLLSPDQVPPALRDLIAANPAVLFPGLNLPPALQHGEGGSHLHLHALQAALWSTLQADLLYLLWALMGSKTKVQAQRQVRHGPH